MKIIELEDLEKRSLLKEDIREREVGEINVNIKEEIVVIEEKEGLVEIVDWRMKRIKIKNEIEENINIRGV